MTASLPTPGGSVGVWGTDLNGFLEVSLNSDGTLNTSALSTALAGVSGLVTLTGSPSLGQVPLATSSSTYKWARQPVDWINAVTEHSADPTGGSDSTTAINAALTAAAAQPNGGVVFLPAGTYETTAPIVIPQGVTLLGSVPASMNIPAADTHLYGTIIKPNGSWSGSGDTNAGAIYITDGGSSCYGTVVENLWVDTSSAPSGCYGISVYGNVSNGALRHVGVFGKSADTTGDGIHIDSSSFGFPDDWTFEHVGVQNFGRYGFYVVANDSTFLACHARAASLSTTSLSAWFIKQAGNSWFLNCRGDQSGDYGFTVDAAPSGAAATPGSSMCFVGGGTQFNYNGGINVVNSSSGGTSIRTPVILSGMTFGNDGRQGGVNPTSGAGVRVQGVNSVEISNCDVVTGGNKGSSNNHYYPEYGLVTSGSGVPQRIRWTGGVINCNTGPVNDGATANPVVDVGSVVGTAWINSSTIAQYSLNLPGGGGGGGSPSGSAGGDLAGSTYPNPVVSKIGGVVTAGTYARGNGTAVVMSTIQVADVPTLNQNTTGLAANVTATLDQIPHPAASVAMNSQKLTGLANGSATTDSAAYGQTLSGGNITPFATPGDILYLNSSSHVVPLPIGASGQVIGSNGTIPGWVNNPAGFSNPMSAKWDLIIGGTSGAATRLAVGSSGQVLSVNSAGHIVWQALSGYVVIDASGDTSGATDATAINAAMTALNGVAGGTVQLGPGDFYINSTITVPQQIGSSPTSGNYPCSLIGSRGATVIHQLCATGIYMHRNVQYGGGGPQNGQPNPMAPMGQLRDFTLNGAGAPSSAGAVGAIGIDCGDGWGGAILDVCVKDFYSSLGNNVGIYLINRVGWSEKWTIRAHTINNDQHVILDTLNPSNSSDVSMEYNVFDLFMYMLGAQFTSGTAGGQMGIQWWNGTFTGGGLIRIRGNHGGGGTGNVGTVLQVGGGASDGAGSPQNWSQIYNTEFDISVEGNGSSNLPHLIRLNSANNSLNGHGLLVSQYGGWQNSVLNGGTFKFSGHIVGDPGLRTGWPSSTWPGFGTVWNNNGPDAQVTVAGGGTTGISLGGTPTGLTSGAFFIKAGNNITVNGSGTAPTWNVLPAT